MDKNFEIFVYSNSENLHLKLKGNFDDSSASQLISVLEEKSTNVSKVFVHTSNLEEILPSGIDMFHKGVNGARNFFKKVMFTGKHAYFIALDRNSVYHKYNNQSITGNGIKL